MTAALARVPDPLGEVAPGGGEQGAGGPVVRGGYAALSMSADYSGLTTAELLATSPGPEVLPAVSASGSGVGDLSATATVGALPAAPSQPSC